MPTALNLPQRRVSGTHLKQGSREKVKFKNTIRDEGSTALYTAYIVNTVDTVYTIKIIHLKQGNRDKVKFNTVFFVIDFEK